MTTAEWITAPLVFIIAAILASSVTGTASTDISAVAPAEMLLLLFLLFSVLFSLMIVVPSLLGICMANIIR